MSELLRLRLAAEAPGGPRVVVARDDLLLLLAAHHDATEGKPEPAQPLAVEPDPDGSAPRPRIVQPPRHDVHPPRGRGHVALAATVEDAKLLAEAAWDTQLEERVAPHGKFVDADPALTWHTVQAALATISAMVEARR